MKLDPKIFEEAAALVDCRRYFCMDALKAVCASGVEQAIHRRAFYWQFLPSWAQVRKASEGSDRWLWWDQDDLESRRIALLLMAEIAKEGL